MKLTVDQKDMLKTLVQHGDVSVITYRLTFTPEEQKWARDHGFVERSRGKFRITQAGRDAFEGKK